MTLREHLHRADEPSRRTFVTGLAAGLFGVGTAPLASPLSGALSQDGAIPLQHATAKRVIYLYMSGGMSQLDTFSPKPGAATQGPTESLQSNADDVRVSEHFPLMARHMDKVCVVESVNSNQGAHAQGQYYMHTSYELRGTIRHPSLGAWLNYMAGPVNKTLPGHVAINGGVYNASGGFLESKYMPLPIGSAEDGLQNSARAEGVSERIFDRRMERLREMNGAFRDRYNTKEVRAYGDMYEQALSLMDSQDLDAFDISKEPESIQAAYGSDPFGKGCLLARRLIEHDVRFVEVVKNGWDTHAENFDQMGELCPPVDRALSALLADLDARGLLEDTMVVLATEFGRTPRINTQRDGRDHYPKAFTCLLAGGGIQGGIKYGKTDAEGHEVIEDIVTVEDFNATIAYGLGLPTEYEMYSPSGRPFRVAHKGIPVKAMFT
ncbi:MAG: DUF1501 domain-containing protein [Planctomycetes bacterium]|nr:DUF1501 domain-containing protein [Planctomycetota bacterium]